jgi:hypothetical protein
MSDTLLRFDAATVQLATITGVYPEPRAQIVVN